MGYLSGNQPSCFAVNLAYCSPPTSHLTPEVGLTGKEMEDEVGQVATALLSSPLS